jgi:hypothetical protein
MTLKLTGGMLQEKVGPDKKEDTEAKPDWRERIRSLSKLQLIVGEFFVKHGIQSTFRLTYDKEASCCSHNSNIWKQHFPFILK